MEGQLGERGTENRGHSSQSHDSDKQLAPTTRKGTNIQDVVDEPNRYRKLMSETTQKLGSLHEVGSMPQETCLTGFPALVLRS